MSVRMSLAFMASLFLVACGNSGNGDAQAQGAASRAASSSASTNWTDATLNDAKVDYFFTSMNKMIDYASAHSDFDMDAMAMDGNETEAAYAKRVGADPQLRKFFDATGIDPVRYANVSGVMTGAMFGVGIAPKNLDPSKMPQAAQYYVAHKAQIDARMSAFQEKAKAMVKRTGRDNS